MPWKIRCYLWKKKKKKTDLLEPYKRKILLIGGYWVFVLSAGGLLQVTKQFILWFVLQNVLKQYYLLIGGEQTEGDKERNRWKNSILSMKNLPLKNINKFEKAVGIMLVKMYGMLNLDGHVWYLLSFLCRIHYYLIGITLSLV